MRHEALLDLPRDRLAQQPLDPAQVLRLVERHQRDRVTGRTGPPGAPDPVDVVLRMGRQLEVHDVRQVLDVEAAGGDVGGHEHPDLAVLEPLEGACPLGLGPVAVDGHGVDALPVEP